MKQLVIVGRILAVFIISIVLIEALTRIFIPPIGLNLRGLYEMNSDPNDFVYEFKPTVSVTYNGVVYKINGQQLRDNQEVAEAKPTGTVRVAIVGDSVAFGYGVSQAETMSELLEKKLAQATSQKVEVLNFAVPGYGVNGELKLIKDRVHKFQPDVVVYALSINDITDAEPIDSQGHQLDIQGSILEKNLIKFSRVYSYFKSIGQFKESRQHMVSSDKNATGSEVGDALTSFQAHIIKSFNKEEPDYAEYYQRLENTLKAYAEEAQSRGYKAVVLVPPVELQLRKDSQPEPQKVTCDLTQQYSSLKCADPLPQFKVAFKDDSTPLFVDFIHVSGKGHDLLAESVRDIIAADLPK